MRTNNFNFTNQLTMLKLFQNLKNPSDNSTTIPFKKSTDASFGKYGKQKQDDTFNPEDMLNSHGVSGMYIGNKNPSDWQKTIPVSEEIQDKLFAQIKSEFIENNGVLEGDTTKVPDLHVDYYRNLPKEDRLSASWTLTTKGREYRTALADAIKKSDPSWTFGKSFDENILKDITRTSIAEKPSLNKRV